MVIRTCNDDDDCYAIRQVHLAFTNGDEISEAAFHSVQPIQLGANNLSKVAMQWLGLDSNPQPSDCTAITPPLLQCTIPILYSECMYNNVHLYSNNTILCRKLIWLQRSSNTNLVNAIFQAQHSIPYRITQISICNIGYKRRCCVLHKDLSNKSWRCIQCKSNKDIRKTYALL